MNANKSIHNLDTLEKEINQQKLNLIEAKKQLGKDLSYFQENLCTLAKNSIKKEKKKEERNSSFLDQVFRNEHFREVISGITSRITDHAAEAVDSLIERIFKKHT